MQAVLVQKSDRGSRMDKRVMKPGNMLAPVPAALISCRGKDGKDNLITIAWTGTACSDPVMVYISVNPSRYSHHMIEETGEFVLNLTTESIIRQTDICGVKSGRDVDKWELTGLTKKEASVVNVPLVAESPVNLECKVKQILRLGSHDMFLAEVVAVDADESLFDKNDRFDLNKAGLVAFSHGEYLALGKKVGSFGYAVRKKK